MNVLIACEESQEVCKAFRAKGHRAFSCDIQECSGGHPEWHIQGDVLPLLNGNCTFQTADSHTHTHTSGAVGSDYRAPAMHLFVQCGDEALLAPMYTGGKSREAMGGPSRSSSFLYAVCPG